MTSQKPGRKSLCLCHPQCLTELSGVLPALCWSWPFYVGKKAQSKRGGGQVPAQPSLMVGAITELSPQEAVGVWPAELQSCISGWSVLRSSLCGAHDVLPPWTPVSGGHTPTPTPHTGPSNQCTFQSVSSLRCCPQGWAGPESLHSQGLLAGLTQAPLRSTYLPILPREYAAASPPTQWQRRRCRSVP